jgi:thiamine biosynthesis protein ThiS
MERAEIIPVEPDPDHAGARESLICFQAFPGFRERFFIVAGVGDPGFLEKRMKLKVNGEPHEHQGDGSIAALLDELGANKEHTALMVNGDVVSSSHWKTTLLTENDEVEMLVFVGGG